MKKIGIIGHFGGNEIFLDGQTVKTKNVKELIEEYCALQTYTVDTFLVKHHKIRLLLKSFLCLFKCKNIIILLSENGMNFYLPFLYYVNKIFRRRIFHDVIGCELVTMVRENPKLVKYLNAIEVNWFEFESGANELKKMGVKNVEVLPNCKKIDAIPFDSVAPYNSEDGSYRFCTFSRVMREKGITDAINSIAEINEKRGAVVARLDVYGQIENDYKNEFEALVQRYSNFVAYRGVVDSQSSTQVLSNYYALLFPTRWRGEGFPGTLLDCYASALPIIATDWNANKEIIISGKTGVLYPSEEFKTLSEAIEWAIDNQSEINGMKSACREEYKKYTPEHISSVINSELMRK